MIFISELILNRSKKDTINELLDETKSENQMIEEVKQCAPASKSPPSLATRKDVVMKSLIRSIKRYYCDSLCNGKQLIPKLANKEATL